MNPPPKGWSLADLGSVTAKPVKQDPATTGRSQVRYVDIGSLEGPNSHLNTAPEIPSVEAPSRCRQLIAAGDTLYSTVRPYLRKVALVGPGLHEEFASTGYCVLRPTHRLDPKYLYLFTLSKHFEEQLFPLQKGVSYPAVLDKEVRGQRIWFPVQKEQRQIVAVVEDHLSRLDAAAAYGNAGKQRLLILRDQLVRAAITGAQVSGPRNPAQLHDAGTADGDLPPLPVGWEWRRLEEVADVVGGVTKDAKKQSDPSYVEVPYLRVANVQRGRLNLDVVTRIRVPAVKAQALALRAGDILLNEGGDRDKLAGGGSGRSKFQTASIRTMFLALDRGSE